MRKGLTGTVKGVALRHIPLFGAILLTAVLCLNLAVMATPKAHAATTQAYDQPFQVDCSSPYWELWIDYHTVYGDPYHICFASVRGYLGTYIPGVDDVTYYGFAPGWVKIYNPGGTYHEFNAGYAYVSFSPEVLLTQICLNCRYP